MNGTIVNTTWGEVWPGDCVDVGILIDRVQYLGLDLHHVTVHLSNGRTMRRLQNEPVRVLRSGGK